MQNKIYIIPYSVKAILNLKSFIKVFLMKNDLFNADLNAEFNIKKESESNNQPLLL